MTSRAGQLPDTRSGGSRVVSLPRALVILVCAPGAGVVFAGVQAAAWLIAPAFLALIIVIAVSPVASALRRHGWPGWLTTLVLGVCVLGTRTLLAFGIIASVAALATQLPQYADSADDLAASVTNWLAPFRGGPGSLKKARGQPGPA